MAYRRTSIRKKRRLVVTLALVVLIAVLLFDQFVLYTETIPFFDDIAGACRDLGEDMALVLAMIRTESRFRAEVVSPRGAVGLMQVMPDTAGWMAALNRLDDYSDDKLYEAGWNLRIGILYLQYLKEQFPDSLPQTLAAYNAGPSRVRAWLTGGDWDGSLARIDDIPYGETREYVKKVLRLYGQYAKKY